MMHMTSSVALLIYAFHPIIALIIVGNLTSFRYFEDLATSTGVWFWLRSSFHFLFVWILYLAAVARCVYAPPIASLIAKIIFSSKARYHGTIMATSVAIPRAERTEHDVQSMDSDTMNQNQTENRYSTKIIYSIENKERFQITSDKKYVYNWSTAENPTICVIQGHPRRYRLAVVGENDNLTYYAILCLVVQAVMGCAVLISVAAAAGMPLLLLWTKATVLQCLQATALMASVAILPGITMLGGQADQADPLPGDWCGELSKPVSIECSEKHLNSV